ncbi:preprotein translocase subunit SecG [Rhodanobacter sp. L36]|uniref:preprotein translocase subunit SecG n=1 Tax=Rhodanobacter sp. L36 TaxID=1747221 RepID=UPI00131AA3E8|nr:preprotein translocase subunit SecG [Rhodanobacter sp. L36]
MFVIFSVFYILIAAAMIVLILLQNGAGADAGSGFGSGASATVFGARGSATFLTRTTGILATLFFLMSLGMGMYLHANGAQHDDGGDLGVMSSAASKPAAQKPAPAPAPATEVPLATPAAANTPAKSAGNVPAAATAPAKKD